MATLRDNEENVTPVDNSVEANSETTIDNTTTETIHEEEVPTTHEPVAHEVKEPPVTHDSSDKSHIPYAKKPKVSSSDSSSTTHVVTTDEGVLTHVPAGYWQAFPGENGAINVFALLGAIFTFIFQPLGLLFAWFGYTNSKLNPKDKVGKYVSLFGVAISGAVCLFFLFGLFTVIFIKLFSSFWMFDFLSQM